MRIRAAVVGSMRIHAARITRQERARYGLEYIALTLLVLGQVPAREILTFHAESTRKTRDVLLLQKRLDDPAAVGAFQAVYPLGDNPVEIVDNGI
jgi:hypothetical protein